MFSKNNNINSSVDKYQKLLDNFQKMLQDQINKENLIQNNIKTYNNDKPKVIKSNSNIIYIIVIVILVIIILGAGSYYFLVIKKKQDDDLSNNRITSDPQKLLYFQENMLPQGTKVRLKNFKFHEYYNKYANSFDGVTGVINWEKSDIIKVELSTIPNNMGHVIFDNTVTTYDQKQWNGLPNVLLKYIDKI